MPAGTLLVVIAIFGIFFVLIALAIVYASRYKKVGPNEVLIISGRTTTVTDPTSGGRVKRSFRIVRGGSAFIWPVLERVDAISLELMTIEVVTTSVYTSQGVPVTVGSASSSPISWSRCRPAS